MKSSIFMLSLALFVGASAAVLAQDQDQSQQGQHQGGHGAFMQACGNDMQTYCASAQSRDDRHSCMEANKDKFSDTCKSFMASHAGHMHGHGQMQGPGSDGQ